MQLKNISLAAFMLVFLSASAFASTGNQATSSTYSIEIQDGKGGKGGKEESKKASTKPSKSAKRSAKAAKQAMKHKQDQIMARAKVRLFFHRMFNTKFGKPVNFRSRRQRRRWKAGR